MAELPRLTTLLATEADTTRWWLQKHGKWLDGAHTVEEIISLSPEFKTRRLYILAPPSSNLKTRRRAKYFLAFDTTIKMKVGEKLCTFDPSTAPNPVGEVKRVITLLRQVRRA